MKNFGIISVFLLTTSIFFSGCGDEEAQEEKIPYVKTQKVSPAAEISENTYSGTVCGRYETNMSFQVGGKIISRNVEVGSIFNPGDLLMTIDPKDILQQSDRGDAQVSSALAQLKLAESNLSRYRQLYAEQAVAAAVLDQYQTQYEAALAAYQSALTEAAEGHNALSYTDLRANAAGVISAINAESGQVVSAGQQVLTLTRTNELEVEINVPENHLTDAPIGKRVTVKFWALPDEISGVIREVSPIADANSKTYKAKISLPEVSPNIRLGMTASVILSGDSDLTPSNAVKLPLSAIYQTGDKAQVWIVADDDTVNLKDVKVISFDDKDAVLSGLKPGEIAVTAGVNKLRENQKVQMRVDEK